MRFSRNDEVREEELAALADDSLSPDRREALDARVAESSELAARLAEQQTALALVRGAVGQVEARPGLRARIEAERLARRPPRVRPRRLVLAAGFATAAAAALALVLTLPSGVGGPSLAEAATAAAQRATEPAPGPAPGQPKLLDAEVEGVEFPSWAAKFGWRTTGSRTDVLDGRPMTTVFYEKDGRRIGYTIVSGEALDVPSDAARTTREGVELSSLQLDGREVVTWLRSGHTCVLSGEGVDRDTLLELASWPGMGAVEF